MEPLICLLFPLKECSSTPTPLVRFRANQQPISPLSRMERIMLCHPSPSLPFPCAQRRVHCPHHFPFLRDLRLITALGLIVLLVVYSLALIQIGIATAAKPCSLSGSGSRLSAGI